jgi:hypothetical protein
MSIVKTDNAIFDAVQKHGVGFVEIVMLKQSLVDRTVQRTGLSEGEAAAVSAISAHLISIERSTDKQIINDTLNRLVPKCFVDHYAKASDCTSEKLDVTWEVPVVVISWRADKKRSLTKHTKKWWWPFGKKRRAKEESSAIKAILTERGVRVCATCNKAWKSSVGAMKDLGIFDNQGAVSFYSPDSVTGLTCTKCGHSFCKDHLGGVVPSSLPGGKCPLCGGTLDLA